MRYKLLIFITLFSCVSSGIIGMENADDSKHLSDEYRAMQFIKHAMLRALNKINKNRNPGKYFSIEMEPEEIFDSSINQTSQGIFLVCKNEAPDSFWSPFGEYKFIKSIAGLRGDWSIDLNIFFTELKENGIEFENEGFEGKCENNSKLSPILRIISIQNSNLPSPSLIESTLKQGITLLQLKKDQ